jgi:6-phosphogluconolactonase
MTIQKIIYPDTKTLAETFAKEILTGIAEAHNSGNPYYMMLSGGSTPKVLFEALAAQVDNGVSWDHVHFFWGDERCVPHDHPDSNYLMTRLTLLDRIPIPQTNIHRIMGENNPEEEAERYASEIEKVRSKQNGKPAFDLIMLGMGDDGHTASIFPHQMQLLNSERYCEVATHPVSGQTRITVTPVILNNARKTVFLVTGASKADVLNEIFEKKGNYQSYPAEYIKPINGKLFWLLDAAAAGI